MIKISFFSQRGALTGFEIKGHSGYAQSDEDDIVCAAVSSAAYMTVNTITDIICSQADIKVEDGYLSVKTDGAGEIQTILKGLRLHLQQLSQDYPENIKVTV